MTTTQEQDRALGLKIVKKFYDGLRFHYPFASSFTFDEMLKTLESRLGGKTFLSGLGLGAYLAEMDDGDIHTAMYSLARKSGGKIPAKNGDFKEYLIDQATTVKFTDAVVYTAQESAKDIVKGAQAVGDTLLDTAKILRWLFIPAVLYFGYKFLNNKVKV